MKKLKQNKKLLFAIPVLALLLVAGGYAYYLKTKPASTDTATEPESIVADPNFSDGTERTPSEQVEKNAKVEETSGEKEQPAPDVEPIVSDEGNISVFLPREGAVLRSGDSISGTAKVDRVYFRLIDNVTGVFTQGSLKVVDGKFSGKFQFETSASEGRLDIFRTLEGGVEADVIEINVKFN